MITQRPLKVHSKLAFVPNALAAFANMFLSYIEQTGNKVDVFYQVCPICGNTKISGTQAVTEEGKEPEIYIDPPSKLSPCPKCEVMNAKYADLLVYINRMFTIKAGLIHGGISPTYAEYILTPNMPEVPEGVKPS